MTSAVPAPLDSDLASRRCRSVNSVALPTNPTVNVVPIYVDQIYIDTVYIK
jgi:hypothetical protein